jgi:hypothetical protein
VKAGRRSFIVAAAALVGSRGLLDAPVVAVRPACAAEAEAQPLFSWLVGRWKGPEVTGWDLSWSQPDPRVQPRGPAVKRALEMTVARSTGGFTGTLAAVASDGRRSVVAELVMPCTPVGCKLKWREGRVTYTLSFEGTGGSYRLAPGDVERGDARQFVRFLTMVRPRTPRRSPYPIIVEIRTLNGRLNLRRVEGPQHGDAADQIYAFERLPDR